MEAGNMAAGNAIVVERASSRAAEYYAALQKLKPEESLVLTRISSKDLRAIQVMAWHDDCRVAKIEGDDGKVSLVLRAKRVAYSKGKPDALAIFTPEDEAERFAASMEKMCRDRRVPVPTWTQMLGMISELGYRMVKPRTPAAG
jgi:hypothetical protein